jgi:hypothetical protein
VFFKDSAWREEKPLAVAMSEFGSTNGFDVFVFLYFVVNGYKRSVERPCQGNNHPHLRAQLDRENRRHFPAAAPKGIAHPDEISGSRR